MNPTEPQNLRDYLVVDQFIAGFAEGAALDFALRSGLIDALVGGVESDRWTRDAWVVRELLETNRVIERTGSTFVLTEPFLDAMRFRDLLEIKLHLSLLFARDVLADFRLVANRGSVPDLSVTTHYMHLYNWALAAGHGPVHPDCATWVAYMSVLTKYEAPTALSLYDFGRHRMMLDVGGNSGEFALQACEANTGLRGLVADLPMVIKAGAEQYGTRAAAAGVEYVELNAFTQVWPSGCDLITFKGVLHDWPDAEADTLLRRAYQALEPGGTILIFERDQQDLNQHRPLELGHMTMLMWAWLFTGPDRYIATLNDLGAIELDVTRLELDLPWMLLTARKPPEGA